MEPITVTVTAGMDIQPRTYEKISVSVTLNNVSPESSAIALGEQLNASYMTALQAYVDSVQATRAYVREMENAPAMDMRRTFTEPHLPSPMVTRAEPLSVEPEGGIEDDDAPGPLAVAVAGEGPPPVGQPFLAGSPLG